MTHLTITGLQKQLDGVPVLRGIELAIPRGAILALLGASGSGKTTLLRLIAGFEQADAGEIALDGRTLTNVPAEQRRIGYVPQEGTLFPHLSVAGNIGFGLTRAERASGRIEEAMRLTGLDGLAARYPHELSGGQQQRTALARALAPRPGLVLLDEPFNALDRALRQSVCADVIAVLRQQGATAILVTHDPQEAFINADLVAVMRQGGIAQCADPETLYRNPVDIEVAQLTGPTIILDGIVHGDTAQTVMGLIQLHPGGPASGPARILLRPDQITPAATGIPARILRRAFHGNHNQLTIAVGNTTLEIPVPSLNPAAEVLNLAVMGKAKAVPR